jgi:hypothetical protein
LSETRPKQAHNAHLYIEKELWDRAKMTALLTNRSVTALVEAALEHFIPLALAERDRPPEEEPDGQEPDGAVPDDADRRGEEGGG